MRLLYLHVPTIWIAYLAFFVTGVASVLWLVPRTRRTEWDLLAGASAEVGVVFTGHHARRRLGVGPPDVGHVLGVGRAAHEHRDPLLPVPRLPRAAPHGRDRRRARQAVRDRGLIAFADVPIVHFSVTWWQTLHQNGTVFNPKLDVTIHGSMAFTLVWSVGAFTLFYVYLMLRRLQLAELEEGLEERELELAIAERQRVEQMVTV